MGNSIGFTPKDASHSIGIFPKSTPPGLRNGGFLYSIPKGEYTSYQDQWTVTGRPLRLFTRQPRPRSKKGREFMDDNGFMAKFSSVDHFFIFVFILVFALTAFWQYIWAFRPIQNLMKKKWLNHLGLAFINLLLLRIIFAGSALWAARLASRHHWGVFQNVETGFMFSAVFTVIFLDWMSYYLHR